MPLSKRKNTMLRPSGPSSYGVKPRSRPPGPLAGTGRPSPQEAATGQPPVGMNAVGKPWTPPWQNNTPQFPAPTPGNNGTIPISPNSQAARNAADRDFTQAQGDDYNAIYQAALQYGDPGEIARFAKLAGATPPVMNDPSSMLSVISRDEPLMRQALGNQLNEGGLFFSGLHQKGEEGISTDVATRRANALRDFQAARDKYMGLLTQAENNRKNVYETTGAQDITDFLNMPPEDKAPRVPFSGSSDYGANQEIPHVKGRGKPQKPSGSNERIKPKKKGKK